MEVLKGETLKLIVLCDTDLNNLDGVNKRCHVNICADINHSRTLLSLVPKDANYPETRFQLQNSSVLPYSQRAPQGGGYEHLFMHQLYTFPSRKVIYIFVTFEILISFFESFLANEMSFHLLFRRLSWCLFLIKFSRLKHPIQPY